MGYWKHKQTTMLMCNTSVLVTSSESISCQEKLEFCSKVLHHQWTWRLWREVLNNTITLSPRHVLSQIVVMLMWGFKTYTTDLCTDFKIIPKIVIFNRNTRGVTVCVCCPPLKVSCFPVHVHSFGRCFCPQTYISSPHIHTGIPVQCLVQGPSDMWTGGISDLTPIPSELHLPTIFHLRLVSTKSTCNCWLK